MVEICTKRHAFAVMLTAGLVGCGGPSGATGASEGPATTSSSTGSSGPESSSTSTEAVTTGDPCAGPTRCPAEGEWPLPKLSDYDFFVQPMREFALKDGV